MMNKLMLRIVAALCFAGLVGALHADDFTDQLRKAIDPVLEAPAEKQG
jgi:hypothetical protein